MGESKSYIPNLDLNLILQVLEIENGNGVLSIDVGMNCRKLFFEYGNVVDIEPKDISVENTIKEYLEFDRTNRKINLEYCIHEKNEKMNESLYSLDDTIPGSSKKYPQFHDEYIENEFDLDDLNEMFGINLENNLQLDEPLYANENQSIKSQLKYKSSLSGQANETKNPIFDLDVWSMLQILEIENGEGIISVKFADNLKKIYFENGNIVNVEPHNITIEDILEEYLKFDKTKCRIYIDYNYNNKKEKKMNKSFHSTNRDGSEMNDDGYETSELEESQSKYLGIMIEILKRDVGKGLISADIWSVNNTKSVASFNSQPKAVNLFDRTTKYLSNLLKDSDFSLTDGYYTINLANQTTIIQIPLGKYQLGMLIDTNKAKTGLILNVTLPKIINTFKEALSN